MVKGFFTIRDAGRNQFRVIQRLWHQGVVRVGHAGCRAAYRRKAAGSGGGPAKILAGYLNAVLSLIVGWVSTMAAHAINFEFAGDKLSHYFIGIFTVELSRSAAGHLPSKQLNKLP
ncbi:MAG: hypothetical protein JSW23_08475 [Planctomycetota bacterium]|nr:MAG: hypothetical protein JSW23_08475 [Planctomycetota bacterium]